MQIGILGGDLVGVTFVPPAPGERAVAQRLTGCE